MDQKFPIIPSSLFVLVFLLLLSLLLLDILAPLQPLNPYISFSSSSSSSSSKLLNRCDYSYGKWVYDENFNIGSYSESCPFLDPGFQCVRNGRNDTGYRNWRWRPHGCDMPRFNASDMLARSINKRIAFIGDSIGRNQWESLVCMLSTSIKNKSNIYEANGNPITKHKGFLSIKFQDFNLTVEYYRSPYLVVVGRPPNSSDDVRRAIRVDTPSWMSKMWVGADMLIFNTGHWWTSDKTIKQGKCFQVDKVLNMTMDVQAAFHKSIETIKEWTISNMRLEKSFIFFRSYSPSHYRNGTWDTGGLCDSSTEPESNLTNILPDPWYNRVIKDTFIGKNIHFLNITYLSESRKDGHASRNREPGTPVDAPQDCSHWCLPGVPDTWNELLYAHLLSNGYDA